MTTEGSPRPPLASDHTLERLRLTDSQILTIEIAASAQLRKLQQSELRVTQIENTLLEEQRHVEWLKAEVDKRRELLVRYRAGRLDEPITEEERRLAMDEHQILRASLSETRSQLEFTAEILCLHKKSHTTELLRRRINATASDCASQQLSDELPDLEMKKADFIRDAEAMRGRNKAVVKTLSNAIKESARVADALRSETAALHQHDEQHDVANADHGFLDSWHDDANADRGLMRRVQLNGAGVQMQKDNQLVDRADSSSSVSKVIGSDGVRHIADFI